MTRACKFLVLILFFIIEQQSGNADIVDVTNGDEVWTATNIFATLNELRNEYLNLPLFKQNVFINGTSININNYIGRLITKENLDVMWSALYIALGCYCGQTIKFMLKTKPTSDTTMDTINKAILKTISVLIDYTNIAPNVVSYEPGILTTMLSLNLHMHILFQYRSERSGIEKYKTSDVKFMINQMVNLIERFTIQNCYLDEYYEDTSKKQNTLNMKKLNNQMTTILTNLGLSTNIILDYENSGVERYKNNIKYSIIIDRVITKLIENSIIIAPQSDSKTILDSNYDIDDIYSYMNLVFDRIVQIVCHILIDFLKLFETLNSESNGTASLATAIRFWSKRQVISSYKTRILNLKSMKFPMRFIAIVELGLRIVRDVIDYQEIVDLEVVKKQITDELKGMLRNRQTGEPELPPLECNVYNGNLMEFLEVIVSIKEFTYFNLIFNLKQNYDPVVRDLTDSVLNKMEYKNYENVNTCDWMKSLYAPCYEMKSVIEKCKSNEECARNTLRPNIEKFLKVIRGAGQRSTDSNLTAILTAVGDYLNRNLLIDLGADMMRLMPIPYATANLLDKYQIHSCRSPVYRAGKFWSYKWIPCIFSKNMMSARALATNADDGNAAEIPPFTKLLMTDYVEKFYRRNSENRLTFYWKGQPRTFKEIADSVRSNPIDRSTFVRYVNMSQTFVVSTHFYVAIDNMEYFLRKHSLLMTQNQNNMLIDFATHLRSVFLPACFVPAANALADVVDFKDSVTLIDNKIMLKRNLMRCGLHRPPDVPAINSGAEDDDSLKVAHLLSDEYYGSVVSWQQSRERPGDYAANLDSFMKVTVGDHQYQESGSDIYRGKSYEPALVKKTFIHFWTKTTAINYSTVVIT